MKNMKNKTALLALTLIAILSFSILPTKAASENIVSNTSEVIISGSVISGNLTIAETIKNIISSKGNSSTVVLNKDVLQIINSAVLGDTTKISDILTAIENSGDGDSTNVVSTERLTAILDSALMGDLTDISSIINSITNK